MGFTTLVAAVAVVVVEEETKISNPFSCDKKIRKLTELFVKI